MKKEIKLISCTGMFFILYSIIFFIIEQANYELIYNNLSYAVLPIVMLGLIALVILINKQFLDEYLKNYKAIIKLSLLCSLVSALSIYIVRIIMELIFTNIQGLNESISWLTLFAAIGFGFFLIVYFISFLIIMKINNKDNKLIKNLN